VQIGEEFLAVEQRGEALGALVTENSLFVVEVAMELVNLGLQDRLAAFIELGAFLGLAMLARVDLGFLVLAMCLDYLAVVRSSIRSGLADARWRPNFSSAAAGCALSMPPRTGPRPDARSLRGTEWVLEGVRRGVERTTRPTTQRGTP